MAWRHTSSVLRYPLTIFAEGTDYLQIDVQKYTSIRKKVVTKNYKMVQTNTGPLIDPKKAFKQGEKKVFTGESTTSYENKSFASNPKSKFRKNSYRQSEATILLPMPSNIQDGNAVSYAEDQLNSISAAAVGGLSNLVKDVGEGTANNEDLTKRFTDAATAAGMDIDIATKLATKYFAGQAVNVFGGNVTVNQLLARQSGQIFNPNMELLFSGPTLRSFRFSFKMTPRNEEEANQIQTIIRTFKKNMAPKTGDSAAFLETPNVFELTYRKGSSTHPFLHKFKQCFLENIGVNYTAEGTYATYGDGTPTSMVMDLSFKELEPIYDIDYDDDGKGVGY
tara:strand:- start:56 stop:1063 length:1008 start_codon:yes stop_codon:yes gene_type:complete